MLQFPYPFAVYPICIIPLNYIRMRSHGLQHTLINSRIVYYFSFSFSTNRFWRYTLAIHIYIYMCISVHLCHLVWDLSIAYLTETEINTVSIHGFETNFPQIKIYWLFALRFPKRMLFY